MIFLIVEADLQEQISNLIEESQKYLRTWKNSIDSKGLVDRVKKLKPIATSPDLWEKDPDNAASILQEYEQLGSVLKTYERLKSNLDGIVEIYKMNDESMYEMVLNETIPLQKELKTWYIQTLFSGENDTNDCFLSITAGAGGTEAQDWTSMLLRMYMRFCEKHNYKVEIIDQLAGEEAGIKSVSIRISGGSYPYGHLKSENGIHRLVRISPFDSNAKRHTSFASVMVTPVIEDTTKVEITDADIRIDTYRASGAGGQHVNKTDSAVRITHIETGLVVQCQSGRSQHQNKAEAMKMLTSKLFALYEQEKLEKADTPEKKSMGWGSQIRSYVLQPYKMVKDLRTQMESPQPEKVLDGDIYDFLIAYLQSL